MEAAGPLIQKVSPLPVPPFLLNEHLYDSLAEALPLDVTDTQPPCTPMLSQYSDYADWPPPASWTFARKLPTGEKLPQTIAHRGYKTKHPENTMGAFRGAVKVGAHAIETDVHLTKDNVVVLSHVSTKSWFV